MSNKSWEDVKKHFNEKYPDIDLNSLNPGKFWKNGWTEEEIAKNPKKWKKHKKERVEFGYSTFDWWSFDSYIAGVIAHACERFASKEAMGHPGDMTWEEWQKYCLEIAKPLKIWASPERWRLSWKDETEVLYPQVQEALRKFADRFGNFWD